MATSQGPQVMEMAMIGHGGGTRQLSIISDM